MVAHDSDIRLNELVAAIWNAKWVILFVQILFGTFLIIYALSIPNQYKSTAILSPSSSDNGGGRLAGSLGSLASLAGVNLAGNSGISSYVAAKEVILTWGFLEKLITGDEAKKELLAVKDWNPDKDKLIINEKIYDVTADQWLIDHKSKGVVKLGPSSWQTYKSIRNRLQVHQDDETGLVYLSMEHYSPYVAKKWVDMIVKEINRYMKESNRKEAIQSIEYLKKQIEKTDISEMRAVFYQLIEEQTKNLMLAEVREDYVFKTLSPAKASEEKSYPKRAFIVIAGLLFVSILSIVFVLLRYVYGKSSKALKVT